MRNNLTIGTILTWSYSEHNKESYDEIIRSNSECVHPEDNKYCINFRFSDFEEITEVLVINTIQQEEPVIRAIQQEEQKIKLW